MYSKIIAVLTIFVPLSFFATIHADSPGNDTIVVWRIEPKTGVTEKEADTISGIVTAEVGRVSGRKTVGENEMKALIVGEEMKMSCGAEDTACVAEIGAALGAPESITGTISKMGDYWILTLQRLNVRSVEVLSRYEKRTKGNVNTLIENILPAVNELFGIKIVEKMPQPASEKLTNMGYAGIGLVGGGSAILIFAGISHWKTGIEQKNYEKGETDGDVSKYNTWKTLSIVSYSVGGIALATGIGLLIADLVIDSPVKTSLIPVPGGAHFSASWRW